ncbi:hypothetical protein GPECTOR_13g701 [Gonium pectorale]|uniref:phytol kinase n=1 Tax=Gonium pectorale TaxID=33097 RepID=A0A150GN39_GONPE|nr:hypothetical protein GPECTOR_13g701 [Gonium pectorale]|eukprot:KXZ51214.1 hypothetical protein GPECTOR_13g701 [Gonium pectorale]
MDSLATGLEKILSELQAAAAGLLMTDDSAIDDIAVPDPDNKEQPPHFAVSVLLQLASENINNADTVALLASKTSFLVMLLHIALPSAATVADGGEDGDGGDGGVAEGDQDGDGGEGGAGQEGADNVALRAMRQQGALRRAAFDAEVEEERWRLLVAAYQVPAAPPPSLAAAIKGGLLPLAERIWRRSARGAPPGVPPELAMLRPLCTWAFTAPLLAYGPPAAAAALAATLRKVCARHFQSMGDASAALGIWALVLVSGIGGATRCLMGGVTAGFLQWLKQPPPPLAPPASLGMSVLGVAAAGAASPPPRSSLPALRLARQASCLMRGSALLALGSRSLSILMAMRMVIASREGCIRGGSIAPVFKDLEEEHVWTLRTLLGWVPPLAGLGAMAEGINSAAGAPPPAHSGGAATAHFCTSAAGEAPAPASVAAPAAAHAACCAAPAGAAAAAASAALHGGLSHAVGLEAAEATTAAATSGWHAAVPAGAPVASTAGVLDAAGEAEPLAPSGALALLQRMAALEVVNGILIAAAAQQRSSGVSALRGGLAGLLVRACGALTAVCPDEEAGGQGCGRDAALLELLIEVLEARPDTDMDSEQQQGGAGRRKLAELGRLVFEEDEGCRRAVRMLAAAAAAAATATTGDERLREGHGGLIPRACPGCANPGCDNLAGDSEADLPLKACAGCGAVGYCCRECQTAHWRTGHKVACGRRREGRDGGSAAGDRPAAGAGEGA